MNLQHLHFVLLGFVDLVIFDILFQVPLTTAPSPGGRRRGALVCYLILAKSLLSQPSLFYAMVVSSCLYLPLKVL